jgi:hypothetical protein
VLCDLIRAQVDALRAPVSEATTLLRTLATDPELAPVRGAVEAKTATQADVVAKLAEALDVALTAVGVAPIAGESQSDKVEKLNGALEEAEQARERDARAVFGLRVELDPGERDREPWCGR